MNKMKFKNHILIITLLVTLMLSGCVEKYDTEPAFKAIEFGTIVDISQVKALYDAELAKVWYERTPVEITEDWAITGIVTGSDKVDGNLYKEGYMEDASAGILLKFLSTGGFYLGDSVIVNVKGLYLGDYGDFIQLGDIPYTDASGNLRVSGFNKDSRIAKPSIGNPSHPTLATISQVKNSNFLGKLVKLNNVQFAGSEIGKTYADALADPPASANRYLEDCDGKSIIVRSSGYATFANDQLPAGGGSITGIITKFNTDYQLIIRDITEVMLDGDRCVPGGQELGDPVETLSETFESYASDVDINTAGWQNLMIAGTRMWRSKIFSSNCYAQATGYLSGLDNMETWLITPPVIISTAKILSFQTAYQYWAHLPGNEPFELYFSTDYNGSNFYSATWTKLSARVAVSTDPQNTFINSGNIALPVEAGKSGVIAFKYKGSGTETTSYRIDNISVTTAK